MEYVRLGNSGLKVSKIILGCMTYGKRTWLPWLLEDEEESIRQIKAAYDAGINTFDTANVFFVVRRDADYSAPPYYNRFDGDKEGYVNQHGIFDSVKQSLERLQLDYIDVLQCHRFDPETPIAETMQALHDVVKAGYVRYIGMSVCYAWQYYALQHNLTPFISMQNQYNLLYREEEREMMPTLKQNTEKGEQDRFMIAYSKNPATFDIIKRVEEIAAKRNIPMGQIALAWLMSKDAVTAPIIGTSSTKNLMELIGSVNVKLTEEEVRYLEEPYQPLPVMQ
ncbi:Aldo/keto reductase [Hymenopellis radicata]|nr:Aldo/keto reductase [Hymenopellis radicata]